MLVFSSFRKKNEVTLTVEIKNFDPELLLIWDAFGTTNWHDNLKVEGKKLVITLPIDKPSMRTFAYGSNAKRIFLYPGQSLEISFDAKNVWISLRAEKSFASEVYKAYQVPCLPYFVIIDKEGNLIDPAAAKPSSKEIRETLDQLLKSK